MKAKLGFIFCIFSLFFAMILAKSFYIQVMNRADLMAYSKKQTERRRKIQPIRAEIVDRNGKPLAINRKTYNLFVNLKTSKISNEELKKITQIVPNLSFEKLALKLEKRRKFTYITRNQYLNDEQVKELKLIKPLGLESKLSRFYPNNELAGQLIGFAGVDNKGLAGVEYSFDAYLNGQNKTHHYIKDAKGRIISENHSSKKINSLQLSIDRNLQEVMEQSLKEVVTKFEADKAGMGIMDAETGEILAIGNYPQVNPNKFGKYQTKDQKLSFITDSFEPGSIIKPLTIASALDMEIIKADEKIITDNGKLIIGEDIVTESFSKEFESMSIEEIIQYSSNIGTSKIAFMLGHEKLMSSLENFGLGQKINIGYPGEATGLIRSDDTSQIRLSNMSFGQGMTASGLQMLAAYSVFANGGYYIEPSLIKRNHLYNRKRVLSEKTVNNVNKMLLKAVEEGTGRKAKMKLFKIAGKTSTAQKVDKKGGYKGYIPGFIGFALNSEKKYVVYSYVDNPKGENYYGNTVAAPMFKKVMEHLLLSEKKIDTLASVLSPKNNRKRLRAKKIKEEGKLPSFIGMDKNAAINLAEKLNLKIEALGFGIVSSQSIKAETELESVSDLTLNFSPPDYD